MSILHVVYQANEKVIKWAKDVQRKRKDKSDISALMSGGGKYKLTNDVKHEIAEFWKPYGKTDPIYQQYYFEKNDIFDVKYLPDDLYYTRIQYFYNNISAAYIVDHKAYYETLFPDIRHPQTIAKRLNGYWIIGNKCVPIEDVVELICNETIAFVKPATGSCGGAGITVLEGQELSEQAFYKAVKPIRGDIVVQKRVEQCDELKNIHESSVNTLRIMSLIDKNGEVIILSRSLRMGTGKSRLDNAHSGGISIGIYEDGRLKDFALTLDGKRFYEHPDSGVKFSSIVLPGIQMVEEAVKKCALRVPAFRIVAWDVILDQDRYPLLIEANLFNAGMHVPQLNNGPLFGERTEELLNEAFERKD